MKKGGWLKEAAATSDAVWPVRSRLPVIAAVFLHRHAASDHTRFYAANAYQTAGNYQSTGYLTLTHSPMTNARCTVSEIFAGCNKKPAKPRKLMCRRNG